MASAEEAFSSKHMLLESEYAHPIPEPPKERSKVVECLCSIKFILFMNVLLFTSVIILITATWTAVNAYILDESTSNLGRKIVNDMADITLQKILPVRMFGDLLLTLQSGIRDTTTSKGSQKKKYLH
jgi:hypothetical protein